jgi:GT2 family glycosyltransferase
MEANNDSLGAVGGSLLHENLEPHISFGHFPSLKQIVFEQFLKYFFKNFYKNHIALTGVVENESNVFEVDYVSGADIMIKKDVFEKLGGFDIDFFLYYEETEMCYRLKKMGFKNLIVPEAKIVHLHKKTEKSILLEKLKLYKASEKLFFRKAYSPARWKIAYALYYVFYFLKYLMSKNHKFHNFLIALKSVGYQ